MVSGARCSRAADGVEDAAARSTFYDWRAKCRAPRCVRLPNGELRIRRTDYESWLESLEEDAA